jgi:hypothetical protein
MKQGPVRFLDAFSSIDGTEEGGASLHIQQSSPAKADDPVRRGLSMKHNSFWNTGSPGQVGATTAEWMAQSNKDRVIASEATLRHSPKGDGGSNPESRWQRWIASSLRSSQ